MLVDRTAPVRITGSRGHGRILLASSSTRRLELLRSAGVEPVVAPVDIDETPQVDETPVRYVERLAKAKAEACEIDRTDVVIAADTAVDLDGRIIGKPRDEQEARAILESLSGREHLVHTGVALRENRFSEVRVVTTRVRFIDIDMPTIDWYLSTGESFDKAGAYALQGSGACLVAGVIGSVTNVIGLPLAESLEMLATR